VDFSARLAKSDTPVISYRWDFGDGVTVKGRQVSHAYTHAGSYSVKLTARGLDGLAKEDRFRFSVVGSIPTKFIPAMNRRYQAIR